MAECFAYLVDKKGEKCGILNEMLCYQKVCPFFKTSEQVKMEEKATAERLKRLGIKFPKE